MGGSQQPEVILVMELAESLGKDCVKAVFAGLVRCSYKDMEAIAGSDNSPESVGAAWKVSDQAIDHQQGMYSWWKVSAAHAAFAEHSQVVQGMADLAAVDEEKSPMVEEMVRQQ